MKTFPQWNHCWTFSYINYLFISFWMVMFRKKTHCDSPRFWYEFAKCPNKRQLNRITTFYLLKTNFMCGGWYIHLSFTSNTWIWSIYTYKEMFHIDYIGFKDEKTVCPSTSRSIEMKIKEKVKTNLKIKSLFCSRID